MCALTATVALDSTAANAIKGGGQVVFMYFVSGGSFPPHTYRFDYVVDVTKRVRSVVSSVAEGYSQGFSWQVEAVGYDSQATQLFHVASALVPIPTPCG